MINVDRPIETYSGLPARILATDIKGDAPLAVAICMPGGEERLLLFTEEGGGEHLYSLRNITETFKAWVNIYDDPPLDTLFSKEGSFERISLASDILYKTREAALDAMHGDAECICTIPITWRV